MFLISQVKYLKKKKRKSIAINYTFSYVSRIHIILCNKVGKLTHIMCVKLRLHCFWLTILFVLLTILFVLLHNFFMCYAQWIFVFVTQLLKVTIKFVFAFNQCLKIQIIRNKYPLKDNIE